MWAGNLYLIPFEITERIRDSVKPHLAHQVSSSDPSIYLNILLTRTVQRVDGQAN